jgi:hypothetical protein
MPAFFASNPLEPAVLEGEYNRLGRRRGSESAREMYLRSVRFWRHAGGGANRWLVERLRKEHRFEVLDAATSLLGDMGRRIVPTILGELDRDDVGDNGLALLGVFRELPPAVCRPYVERLGPILRRYLKHPKPEFREAAGKATVALPNADASALLMEHIREEPDLLVLTTLVDVLADLNDRRG